MAVTFPQPTSNIPGILGVQPSSGLPPSPQQGTLTNDLASGGTLSELDQLLTSLNIGGQTAANEARVPQDKALETQSSKDISSELSGGLPPDVVNLLSQQSAERGVSTGMPGAPANNASLLQALGLTSLGQIQTGESNLTGADARNPVAIVPNAASGIFTPPIQTTPAVYSSTSGTAGVPSQPVTDNSQPQSFPQTTGTASAGGLDPALLASLFGDGALPNPATGNAGYTTGDPAAVQVGDNTDPESNDQLDQLYAS